MCLKPEIKFKFVELKSKIRILQKLFTLILVFRIKNYPVFYQLLTNW